jgi:cation transporter-like permease
MDVTGIARLATTMAETGTRQEVGLTVLKKAEDLQASTANALLEAIPPATPATSGNLPSHLGTRINTTA